MNKFKKGEVVTFPYSVTLTWEEYTGTIVSKAKFLNKYRVRLRPPITKASFEKTDGNIYTALVDTEKMKLDTIETVKSIMRKRDKKDTNIPKSKTKASKRISKN